MHIEVALSPRIVILEDRFHKKYAELKHYVGRTGRKRCCNEDWVKLEKEANSSDKLTNQNAIDEFLTPAVTHGKYYCL